jgi:catechol 2,3-dioxygenase
MMPERRTAMTAETISAGGATAPHVPTNAKENIVRSFSFTTPIHIGAVTLKVRDLDKISKFYQDVIGLKEIRRSGGLAELGAGDKIFLKLVHDPQAIADTGRSAGLYHTAFLLPSRTDLAQWLLHIAARRVQLQGAADHIVSEAFYLADPEGNGIEVYIDRPEAGWVWTGGKVQMASDPLDIDGLAASVAAPDWRGAPIGTGIGHVHLRVGEIAPAEAFYNGLLGLDITAGWGPATFYSSGGYHHHIATNIWQSHGAPMRGANEAGLVEVEFLVTDKVLWTALSERLRASGLPLEEKDGGVLVPDPWQTKALLKSIV